MLNHSMLGKIMEKLVVIRGEFLGLIFNLLECLSGKNRWEFYFNLKKLCRKEIGDWTDWYKLIPITCFLPGVSVPVRLTAKQFYDAGCDSINGGTSKHFLALLEQEFGPVAGRTYGCIDFKRDCLDEDILSIMRREDVVTTPLDVLLLIEMANKGVGLLGRRDDNYIFYIETEKFTEKEEHLVYLNSVGKRVVLLNVSACYGHVMAGDPDEWTVRANPINKFIESGRVITNKTPVSVGSLPV